MMRRRLRTSSHVSTHGTTRQLSKARRFRILGVVPADTGECSRARLLRSTLTLTLICASKHSGECLNVDAVERKRRNVDTSRPIAKQVLPQRAPARDTATPRPSSRQTCKSQATNHGHVSRHMQPRPLLKAASQPLSGPANQGKCQVGWTPGRQSAIRCCCLPYNNLQSQHGRHAVQVALPMHDAECSATFRR